MARFKPGQKVVCVKDGLWRVIHGHDRKHPNPKYGDIVTVESISLNSDEHISFIEFPFNTFYSDKWFEPLMDITELTSILESQPETV